MRNLIASTVLAAAIAGVSLFSSKSYAQPVQPAAAKEQAAVPVKVVVLFSSGVGYFEHAGNVTGNTSTELRFKTNQINDILKSLLLQDMGGGKVTTVVYPSQDPIEKTLRSFQVDITGDPSLAELLGQLRGAKVQVTIAGETVGGTILGLEKKPKAVGEKGVIEVWVLNLITGGTIRAVELAEAKKIELEDPQLQEELSKALTALAQARDQDKKPVTINFSGNGDRQVRIGYVVETPIWKTSYRLVLPGEANEKPKLLGWAIVENQTDNDWSNVQLNLVSGRPISFIQDLYRPLYIPRPVVQPELYASLRPQTYDAGMDRQKDALADAEENDQSRFAQRGNNRAAAPAEKAKADPSSFGELQQRGQGGGGFGYATTRPMAPMNATASVASIASAAKVGELFQYTVGNVSLPRQRSAMLPIITDDVEIEKLSIYNAAVLPRNPLYGARIKNTTGKHLLQGPITVIEGSAYAGDAKIDNLPPTQERLISYGVDLQMLVDAKSGRNDASILAGKIVKGVLWLTHKNVFTQEYTAENKGDKEKTLVVEHPFRQGWKLVTPEKPMEKTDTLYRFKAPIAAGKGASVKVIEENVAAQSIAIFTADTGTLEHYSKTGVINKDVRDVLTKAIGMKHAMTDTTRQINERTKQINEITQEQARIRENLKTVERNSDYAGRLLKKLNDQETKIEQLQAESVELQAQFNRQRKELEDYLTGTTIGE